MSDIPPISDGRGSNRDDDTETCSTSEPRIQPVLMTRYYALSFLAERGELTPRPVTGRASSLS